MEETMKAYLAGILDADGYFTIKRSTYHIRVLGTAHNPVYSEKVGCKQVQPEAIDLLHQYFGGYRRVEKPSAVHGKPLYAWSVTDKKAYNLVIELLPYLKIKRRQAELLVDLRKSKNTMARVNTGETYTMKHWTGKDVTMPCRMVDPIQIQIRDELVCAIHKLNDTRINQPRLIGKG